MKKYYLFTGLVLLAASPAFAQTKIGAAGAPDGSAMLEVTSGTGNNKGLLMPRMTTTQRNAITSPATGLMIYNTTSNQVQVNTGTPAAPIWTAATATNSGWDLTGNGGTSVATNFIGTTDNQPLVVRTNNEEQVRVTAAGNVGIGATVPVAKLHVVDTGDASIRVGNNGGTRGHIQLGNNNHGLVRDLSSSGGGINDVALYTSTGSVAGSTSSLYLVSNPSSSGSGSLPLDQFVLKNTGDVGVGTNTPAQKLHVQGTARISTAVGTPTTITGRNAAGDVGNVTLGTGLSLTGGVLNTTADNADWNLTGNTGTNPLTNFIGTGDAQPLVIRTNNTEKVRVTAAGDMGVGTGAPAQTLHVAGTARITGATGTPTTITGRNATGDVGNITLGTGLSLTAGTLAVTGGTNDWDLTGNAGTNPSTNFIGTSDNQPLVVRTNNTEKLRVTSAGKVGIGNSTPIFTLDVEGGVRVQRDTLRASNSGSSILWNAVNIGRGETDFINYRGTGAGGFRFYNLSPGITPDSAVGELMYITGAGTVGIGTGAPAQTLHVAGTARISTAVGTPTTISGRNAAGDVGNVTLGSGLSLTGGVLNTTADNADWNLTGNTGSNPATDFIGTGDAQPLVIRTNNTENVRVTAAGNVGIGTQNPLTKLAVNEGSLSISSTAPISSSVIQVINNGGGPNLNDDVDIYSYGANTAPGYGMWTARGTATAPLNAQALDFAGTLRFGSRVNGAQAELNRIQSVYLGDGTTEKSRLSLCVNGANPVLSLDSSGYVGIGTLTPTALLSVNGATNNTTGVWSIFSDARVKTVDGEYEDGLATVMKIHPVKFHYNKNAPFKSEEQQIGIIAQEMEQIAPYMVSKMKADGFNDLRQYNSQALPYMLVNAIQEQQAQIEALKAKNEQLEAKNEQLEASNKVTAQLIERVKQMEQMMGINEIEGTSKVAGK